MRAPRIIFFVVVVAAVWSEAVALFMPTSDLLAAGYRPYVIEALAAGERVGQTFRILDDGLESVDLELSSTGPALITIASRIMTWNGSSPDHPWLPVYEAKQTLTLPRGRSWHHFAFTPIFPSKQVYQFQIEQLDVRSPDSKQAGRPTVGVMASEDDFLETGNVVVGKEQVVHSDLFFEARTASQFVRFRGRANPLLPRPLRNDVVQLGLVAAFNCALAVFAYEMTIRGPEQGKRDQ